MRVVRWKCPPPVSPGVVGARERMKRDGSANPFGMAAKGMVKGMASMAAKPPPGPAPLLPVIARNRAAAQQSAFLDAQTRSAAFKDAASVETAAFQARAKEGHISLGRCSSRELLKRPYWQQGSKRFDDPANKAAREALRKHPRVLEALETWWSTAERNAAPEERNAKGGLLEAPYRTLSKKIYKAMIERWDEAAAGKSATEDWECDAKGGTSLDRGAFADSLFELADTWAFEIDPNEYACLLWELFSCLTYGEPCEQATWKELHEIRYLGDWKGEKKGYGRFAGPPDPDGSRARAAAAEKAAADAKLAAEAEAAMRARMEAEERARAEQEAAAAAKAAALAAKAAAAREAAAREAAAKEAAARAAAGEMEVRARINTLPSTTTMITMITMITTTSLPPLPLCRPRPSSPPLTLSSPLLTADAFPTATPGQDQGRDGAAAPCRKAIDSACRKAQACCQARARTGRNRLHEE